MRTRAPGKLRGSPRGRSRVTPLSPTVGIRTVVAAAPQGLAVHARAWDRLAASLAPVQPMTAHAWQATWFEEHAREGGRGLVFLAYAGDRLLGVLPASIEGHAGRPTVLVPCAYNTAAGDLALDPERSAETLRSLLRAVRVAVPGVTAVDIGSVRDDSPTLAALGRGVPGWWRFQQVDVEGASVPIEGAFSDWCARWSPSLRRDVKSADNRIRREQKDLVVRVLEGADARADTLEDLVRLEASGWKGKEGSAIASREQSLRKYRSLAQRFAGRGWLEWHLLSLSGRLVAARMAVRLQHGLMLLRSAYDESFSKYHVGHLSFRALVEREFARGRGGEVNLVTTWPWVTRWGMRLRPYTRARLVRLRPAAIVRAGLPEMARSVGRRVPWVRRYGQRHRAEGGNGVVAGRTEGTEGPS